MCRGVLGDAILQGSKKKRCESISFLFDMSAFLEYDELTNIKIKGVIIMRKDFGAKPMLVPQPVCILATYDENGVPNAMNAAWAGIAEMNQIIVCLGPHKTTENLEKCPDFTLSVGTKEQVVACDYVGIVSGNKVPDKVAKAGFTTIKAPHVNAPIINELPLTMECKLLKILEDELYLAEIVNVCVDESVLNEDGLISYEKFHPIIYDTLFHGYYELGAKVGNAFSDGKKIK